MSAAQVNVEHMFEYWYASRPTPESAAPLGRVREAARAEAQAAARRLVAIGELLVLRCRETTRRKTGPSASPPTRHNRDARMARHAEHSTYVGPPPPGGDDDPPPF